MSRVGWAAFTAAALLPLIWHSNFALIVATQMVIACLFATSLNVLIGYGGLVNFGHAAFFGLSGYVYAIALLQYHIPIAAACVLALAVVPVVATGFAAVALRTSGISFVMITLALGQLFWSFAGRAVDITGGDNGLANIAGPVLVIPGLVPASGIFWLGLACLAVCVLLVRRFMASHLGVAFQGTRDQPRRMATLGFNVTLIRVIAFAFAAFWAGLAGLLQVFATQFVHPSAMSLNDSAEVLLMVIVGGVSSLAGPIVGAIVVVFFKSIVSMYFQQWLLVLGLTFFAVVFFLPDGLVDGTRRLLALRVARRAGEVRADG